MKAKRILFLDRLAPRSRSTLGGGQRYLLQLAPALLAESFDVGVCVNNEPTARPFFDELMGMGVTVHFLPFRDSEVGRMAMAFDEVTARLRPEILHLHNHSAHMRAVAARMRGFRQSLQMRTFTMHLPLPSIGYIASAKVSLKDRLPFVWFWRTSRKDRKLLRLFDRIICVSTLHSKLLVALHHIPADLITNIPNGVDTELFSPCSPRDSAGRVVSIGGAGLLEGYKRFDLLIDAVYHLQTDQSFTVRIAGEGSEQTRLREQIQQCGLEKSIRLVGHQNDMPAFFKTLDLFVMSSEVEGCPFALLEAMAAGLPAVVTDAGDMPLLIRDGIDGFVVPRGNVAMLSDRIGLLIASPELRQSMALSARRRVCEEFSLHTAMRKTTALFVGMTEGR